MAIIQVAVFIENREGRIKDITSVLAKAKIDIRSLSIAETKDFGVLRLIVDNPDKAYDTLKKADFVVRKTEVLAVEVPDHPGGLDSLLDILEQNGLNIEYMYAFPERAEEKAVMIMRFDDTDLAKEKLNQSELSLASADKIYSL